MNVLACLAIGLLQPSIDDDIARAIDKLYSERHTESEVGKVELIEIGRKSVAAVVAELRRGPEEKPRTPDARVKRLLCEILGAVRDSSSGAVDALIAKLQDPDEFGFSVASSAAAALTSIGDPKAVTALVRALGSKQAEHDPWLKYETIHGLGVFRAAEAAETIQKSLEDKSAAMVGADERIHLIRAAAADALGRLRAKGATDALGKLLNDNEQNPYTQKTVSFHAARALERVLGEAKGALDGDDKTVNETLAAWRKWWDGLSTKKNLASTRDRLALIVAAIEKYKADQGEYPVVLEYLATKPATAKTWPEGGYTKEPLKDAWDRNFIYRMPGTGAPFDLLSHGKDGREWGRGDDADLWSHNQWRAVKADATRKAIDDTAKILQQFNADQGQYPDTLNDLKLKPAYAKKWEKPYIADLPRDGFGHYLTYKKGGTEGEPFDLTSDGADNRKGGIDENADLWNHDKWKAALVEPTKKRIEALVKAVEAFRKAEERLPEALADLKEKPAWAKKFPAGGHTTEALNDAFGNDFVYAVTDAAKGEFEIKSLGGDGRPGGAGADEDLSSAKK